ncbi:transglutaminase family protein [Lacimicrobium sp. SS2-24]|uniref:transglutaminase-like domain-containing protein n=1 Tax=Lacimicrobium sp. SS2-24 TaxID=2005569 RepID=UPI000B4BBB9F|nr:transglutaminase family protein [Lacimicrobium sp. SS2-24]
MKIRIGYELVFHCPRPTQMLLVLNIHPSRVADLIIAEQIFSEPRIPVRSYFDSYGNHCTRIIAPKGLLQLSTDTVIEENGVSDTVNPKVRHIPVEHLPDETLIFLLGSRYCETDRLVDIAWQLFGNEVTDCYRVQAICNYVHNHIAFSCQDARKTKTAWEVFKEKKGVYRDYAHLAITLCRCMNIPARYCTGYLVDTGFPQPHAEMDFAAWFEVYLDGHWHLFNPRNNAPRSGHILIARGRDAADVAITTAFGPNTLEYFKVHTDEIQESSPSHQKEIS